MDRPSKPLPEPVSSVSDREEIAVLGAMLRQPVCIADVVVALRVEDFRTHAHQAIFRAAASIWESGAVADAVAVADRMHREGTLAEAGGYEFLAVLLEYAATPFAVMHHARLVRERSIFRQLQSVGVEIAQSGAEPMGSAQEALEEAERRIFAIASLGLDGETIPVAAAADLAVERIDARTTRDPSQAPVPTGFIDLDRLTSGFQPGNLILVAARPSVGKTALALAMAWKMAQRDLPVLFVSLEQEAPELAERLLCMVSGVDSQAPREGILTEQQSRALLDAREYVRTRPLFIDSTPIQGTLRIAANARRLRLRKQIRCVFVDYLQLIEPENRRAPRHEQVEGISRRMKLLAREIGVPVVALCQLNRESEHDEDRPRLHHLRSSGALEQDADTVFLLHRPATEAKDARIHRIEVLVAKQRNGPTGDVVLAYRRSCMRFEDCATERDGYVAGS